MDVHARFAHQPFQRRGDGWAVIRQVADLRLLRLQLGGEEFGFLLGLHGFYSLGERLGKLLLNVGQFHFRWLVCDHSITLTLAEESRAALKSALGQYQSSFTIWPIRSILDHE